MNDPIMIDVENNGKIKSLTGITTARNGQLEILLTSKEGDYYISVYEKLHGSANIQNFKVDIEFVWALGGMLENVEYLTDKEERN